MRRSQMFHQICRLTKATHLTNGLIRLQSTVNCQLLYHQGAIPISK
ncbi:MAG: hypothetical protein HC789_13790 [Microcoleus sp. CSU_2_2]|nr:hypothetical protein [Microcoleus sp. CSU_2_2]